MCSYTCSIAHAHPHSIYINAHTHNRSNCEGSLYTKQSKNTITCCPRIYIYSFTLYCLCLSIFFLYVQCCSFNHYVNLLQISFSDWFLSKGGTRMSITKMWDPVAYALGFIDCDNISARCMLTIFALFATKTEASLLRMLKGSPDVYLSGPIRKYITDRGGRYNFRYKNIATISIQISSYLDSHSLLEQVPS